MAFPPLHSSLPVLRVICLKIKWLFGPGESLWCCSVGTWPPRRWQLVLAGDPGRADSSSRVFFSSTFYANRRVLLWLRRAEEGNCGAYSPNQNSQPQTGIFLKLLLGQGFHKNHRVTALNPSSPHHPAAIGIKENLGGQLQWNYSWFMLR